MAVRSRRRSPVWTAEAAAQREAYRITLAKYAPAGVVANASFEIVQFRGSTSRSLEPTPRKASFYVLQMEPEGLLLPLCNAPSAMAKPCARNGGGSHPR